MTVARATISRRRASTASSASSREPDSATITGSWTIGVPCGSSSSARATVSIVATSPSIPIFTASMPRSSATARIWPVMIAGSIGCTAETATVFCTVIAVIAVRPVHAGARERLQVGLDPRSAAGVRAGDRERDGDAANGREDWTDWTDRRTRRAGRARARG